MQAAVAHDMIAAAYFDNDPKHGGTPLLKALRTVFGAEHCGACEDSVCPTYGRMYFDATEDGDYFVMDRKDCTIVIRKGAGGGGWVTARAAGPPQDARMDLRLRLFLRAVAVSVAAAKSRGSAPSRGNAEDASRAEASNALGAALTAASAIHHDR